MKPITAAVIVAAAAALLAADYSDAARRLGGGKSLGAQRPQAAQQQAAPPAQPGSPAGATTSNAAPAASPGAGPATNPVMAPAGPAAAAKAPAAGAATGAAQGATRSSWMGPVAGLAAGLGLAWLAHSLGFSEELMSILLIALLAMAALFVVRLLMSRRAVSRPTMPYAGAGAGLGSTPGGYETQVPPPARFEPVFGGPPLTATRTPVFPPGFDAVAFASEAKKQFLAVQAMHDRHDSKALAEVMTPELHREIIREMEASGAARPTEIVEVDAEVVDVATEGRQHWVSVRFSGTAREGGALEPFDEVWNLVKPVDGSSGWMIAGIQQQVMPS